MTGERKLSRKTYRMVAEVLSKASDAHIIRNKQRRIVIKHVAAHFVALFIKDNPSFISEVFYQACGFEEVHQEKAGMSTPDAMTATFQAQQRLSRED